jgi:hypothetical protein
LDAASLATIHATEACAGSSKRGGGVGGGKRETRREWADREDKKSRASCERGKKKTHYKGLRSGMTGWQEWLCKITRSWLASLSIARREESNDDERWERKDGRTLKYKKKSFV